MKPKQKPNFFFMVVSMKKPFGVLTYKKPTRDQVLEIIADLLQNREAELEECFDILEYDITEDIEGAFGGELPEAS